MQKSIRDTLGHFAYATGYADLPPEVIEKTKTCLIHGIGIGLAAYETETAQNAVDMAISDDISE